jgi:ubiquinone/menaquinone biosynthesis C-methylase UbiE
VGRAFAEALGYPRAVLDHLPTGVYEAFTGVATPSLRADFRPGDVVVDLGCGGGLDLSLAAWMVGPRGRVVGIDFAPGMVDRTRRNIELLNLPQAEVRLAPAEATGLDDGSADWVIANGILNLSPDKEAILEEIVRILRPGGRFLLAETALSVPLPLGGANSLQDWFR